MIKLNNKNITYVALADSNNSLKAPKEIWYADSNNSVKLVYRRKDALIEGEDYEKYHWLDGDGSAYIDTELTLSETDVIETKILNKTIPSTYYIIYGNDSSQFQKLACILFNNEYLRFRPTGTNSDTFIVSQLETEYAIVQSTTKLIVNNVDKWHGDSVSQISTEKCCIFSAGITAAHSYCYDGKIAYFDISDRINLIPCKLLKPVPKWLDANGIRRQVGECGMIDLISGKFYGNVNSVGTFTVENYYERKEHLVSTNAYIDTKLKNITDKNITISFSYALNTSQGVLFGSEVYSPTNRISMGHHLINDNFGIWFWDSNPGRKISDDYKNLTVILDATQSKTFVNGINITDYNPPQSELYNNILLFAYYRKQTIDSDAALITSPVGTMIDNFIVQNTMNLIPCTLTMDLPASMDANNIARTKGTSGMWDLVSDRFYGNVANSGTFKAVNLAEGVDYEVHQWLVRNGGAYISIPINLWQNRFDMCIEVIENYTYFNTYSETNPNGRCFMVYNLGGGNPYILIAFREGGSSHITELRVSKALPSNTISIFQKDGIATGIINGVEYQDAELVESSWNYDIECSVPLGKTQYFKVYNCDGTYRSNLIPVKLLKSIPSKYDANGIARQAGECGMYDTVNDIFYGNVASSGSFTVEDDN